MDNTVEMEGYDERVKTCQNSLKNEFDRMREIMLSKILTLENEVRHDSMKLRVDRTTQTSYEESRNNNVATQTMTDENHAENYLLVNIDCKINSLKRYIDTKFENFSRLNNEIIHENYRPFQQNQPTEHLGNKCSERLETQFTEKSETNHPERLGTNMTKFVFDENKVFTTKIHSRNDSASRVTYSNVCHSSDSTKAMYRSPINTPRNDSKYIYDKPKERSPINTSRIDVKYNYDHPKERSPINTPRIDAKYNYDKPKETYQSMPCMKYGHGKTKEPFPTLITYNGNKPSISSERKQYSANTKTVSSCTTTKAHKMSSDHHVSLKTKTENVDIDHKSEVPYKKKSEEKLEYVTKEDTNNKTTNSIHTSSIGDHLTARTKVSLSPGHFGKWHADVFQSYDEKAIQANRESLTRSLIESTFSRFALANSNVKGARGKFMLDPMKIAQIRQVVFSQFPAKTLEDEERIWRILTTKINTKCRGVKRLMKRKDLLRDSLSDDDDILPKKHRSSPQHFEPFISEDDGVQIQHVALDQHRETLSDEEDLTSNRHTSTDEEDTATVPVKKRHSALDDNATFAGKD